MTLRRLRIWAVGAMLTTLAACGGGSGIDVSEAPKNQNNVCSIFDQRPGWRDAVTRSERKWGAPAAVQMAILWRESSFRSNVRPMRTNFLGLKRRASSAFGFSQAIDGTWDWYRKDTGNRGADRTDFEDSADFVGWYMAKTARSNGVGMHDAYNHYLAYHEGHAGHRRGTYRKKDWLVDVAGKVAAQAARYRGQMRTC